MSTANGDPVEMTGGEAMARAALANGIDTVFGIPGAQIYPLFDAFHRLGVRTITPRHEQAAAYMAMGAAKSTGRLGAFSVVPGPGILNTMAALCTAEGTCSPVLGLTGQVPSSFAGIGRGHLHELRNQAATIASVAKDAFVATDATDASVVVNDAAALAGSGRPGPVTVEMAWDTMAASGKAEIEPPIRFERPELDGDAIAAAARLLATARQPLIMCGAGAQHASAEVRALAEALGVPVTAFRSGRGVLPADHPLWLDSVAARALWDDVDVVVGVGSRLEMLTMRWRNMMQYESRLDGGRSLVRIDIDEAEMDRLVPDVAIVADAADACAALRAAGVTRGAGWVGGEHLAGLRAEAAARYAVVQPQVDYLAAIRQTLPRDGFFVPELSQMGFASYFAFDVFEPRTYVTEGYQGTLGFGFSTALGVKAANPDRAVVSVTGDGGFMFGVQELATAAQYGIGLVTIVFDNDGYGNVRRDQDTRFGGRRVGADFANPDLAALSRSFGVAATSVETPAALGPALSAALADGGPHTIIVKDGRTETSPWNFIHM